MVERLADAVVVVSVEMVMLCDVVTRTSQASPDFLALFVDVVGIPDLIAVQHERNVVVLLLGLLELSGPHVSNLLDALVAPFDPVVQFGHEF